MHTPHVLINVRGLLAAEIAVRTLIPGRFAALVPVMTEHGVPSAVTVVAIGTVELAGVRIVLCVPFPPVLLPVHDMKLHGPATYKRSCHGQHRRSLGTCLGNILFENENAPRFHAEGIFAGSKKKKREIQRENETAEVNREKRCKTQKNIEVRVTWT